MLGLGDNIYQRAFIRRITEPVYLSTPWPQLYKDLPNVRFTQCDTRLRTQKKNVDRTKTIRHRAPTGGKVQIMYREDGPLNGMRKAFGFEPELLDLPDFGPSPVGGDYIVVRPVTVRTEWQAESRNPNPRYIAEAAQMARDAGFKIISVADLEDGKEWALDPLPVADVTYHKGELNVEQLMALVKHAKAVIAPIGWIVPAAIAYGVPGWIVCGGYGAYNRPDKIDDPRNSKLTFVAPKPMCMCDDKSHRCNKEITQHDERFARWLSDTF